MLSKADILGAKDLPTEDVAVPEWGGTVRVRSLKGHERDLLEAETATAPGTPAQRLTHLRARIAALAIVGEDGKRVFDDTDILALSNKSAAALDRVFTVARRLAGMSQEDVEELKKTSSPGPAVSSPSASP